MTKTIRLDKYLTDCRTGSRSEVKNLIRKGLVKVNEATCTDPALHISTSDHVSLDGRTVEYKQHVYYMLNKPAGYVSATKDAKERTVLDLFPEELRNRLFPVGRLDKDSVGLLIICDDGELSHALTSPATHTEKKYLIRTDEALDDSDIAAFYNGITLADGSRLKSAKLEPDEEDRCCALVTISEGKYHQIKRMIASRGKKVTYLKRISMGNLVLDPKLGEGCYRELTDEEIEDLR